ncbi:MAG: bifunctional demethylmenaquinone methyltransferase/2-methoxy-6-polyprenyl-1,4-benzoquinol methylase UbiE [Muribaculaceae bacterium]|nr:bifunctional demethylmenaquinone methyltransferase/2-methoxy-6-polyprenyl-1,4-benzoquinol methylase UbiE [Muribaculaceae bacterium]
MDYKAEKINPYNDLESKTGQVRQMFDSIAPAYDFMNRAMTFGIDKLWRRRAVNIIKKNAPAKILDVATGTGDLAFLLNKMLAPKEIIGIDLSQGMLDVATEKAKKAGTGDTILFEQGDCLNLRFEDNYFDAITVAYGVRNFEHLERGYQEMYRVLAPGGVLCVIELSTPTNPLVKPLYRFYTNCLIPLIGRSISKDRRAYSYLPESIAAVAQGNEMLGIMRRAGFEDGYFKALTFGVCTLYFATKRI